MLCLERADRLQPQTFAGPMRHKVDDRPSIAGDDDGLAILDLSGEFGQPVFGFADGNGRHEENVATCGYVDKDPPILPRIAGEVAPKTTEGRPSTMLRMVPLPRFAGEDQLPYQASTQGRFFPSCETFGTERRPAITQRRVSAGSITSSISNTEAMEVALPFSYICATFA